MKAPEPMRAEYQAHVGEPRRDDRDSCEQLFGVRRRV
jgi:hypothetical protein